jgi:hypothetical protein
MLNKLTGEELLSLNRTAQMISHLNDKLIDEGFVGDASFLGKILAAATPALIERSFNGS